MVLTIFVNNPMGKRCRINLDAAHAVQKEYPVHIEVIKNGSDEYANTVNPPACPSVMLDGRLIKEYGVVTADELRHEMLKFLL